jgi:hypothetical protein
MDALTIVTQKRRDEALAGRQEAKSATPMHDADPVMSPRAEET